jgi:hypothetical protein
MLRQHMIKEHPTDQYGRFLKDGYWRDIEFILKVAGQIDRIPSRGTSGVTSYEGTFSLACVQGRGSFGQSHMGEGRRFAIIICQLDYLCADDYHAANRTHPSYPYEYVCL